MREPKTPERSQLLKHVHQFLGKQNVSAASNSIPHHELSLLVSAVAGTGTNNYLKIQCAASLLEARSVQSGLPSSPSVGQRFAPTVVIHPAELSDLKQHVAWGGGSQRAQSLHRCWRSPCMCWPCFQLFCHTYLAPLCLFLIHFFHSRCFCLLPKVWPKQANRNPGMT